MSPVIAEQTRLRVTMNPRDALTAEVGVTWLRLISDAMSCVVKVSLNCHSMHGVIL
jgi:hypothetical protein